MADDAESTRRRVLKTSALLGWAALSGNLTARAEAAASRARPLPTPRFVFQLRVELGEPQEIGEVGSGYRRIVPITGGTFAGPELKGTVLPFGADWQLISPAGKMELDARYTLRTDRKELIYVHNRGGIYMPPAMIPDIIANRPTNDAQMQPMGACRMESGAERLRWMNSRYFIPRLRGDDGPLVIDFYEIA